MIVSRRKVKSFDQVIRICSFDLFNLSKIFILTFSPFSAVQKKIQMKQYSTIPYGITPHIAHSLESEVSHRLQALSASWQQETGKLIQSLNLQALILMKYSTSLYL